MENKNKLISTPRVMFNMFKNHVGSGILGLPFGFRSGGWLLSILTLPIACCLTNFGMLTLVKTKEALTNKRTYTFADVGRAAFGLWGLIITQIFLVFYLFGGNCSYMMFISTSFTNLLPFFSQGIWALLLMSAFFLLSFMRSMKTTSYFSFIATTSVFVGLVLMLIFVFVDLPPTSDVVPVNTKAFSVFLGIVLFSFEGIGLALPINNSMLARRHYPRAHGFILVCVCSLYILFGALCYFRLGTLTPEVITQTFDVGWASKPEQQQAQEQAQEQVRKQAQEQKAVTEQQHAQTQAREHDASLGSGKYDGSDDGDGWGRGRDRQEEMGVGRGAVVRGGKAAGGSGGADIGEKGFRSSSFSSLSSSSLAAAKRSRFFVVAEKIIAVLFVLQIMASMHLNLFPIYTMADNLFRVRRWKHGDGIHGVVEGAGDDDYHGNRKTTLADAAKFWLVTSVSRAVILFLVSIPSLIPSLQKHFPYFVSVVGATAGSVVSFVLPLIFHLKILWHPRPSALYDFGAGVVEGETAAEDGPQASAEAGVGETTMLLLGGDGKRLQTSSNRRSAGAGAGAMVAGSTNKDGDGEGYWEDRKSVV